MAGKTYRAAKEKAPTEAVSLAEAVQFLKENTRSTFDETVEVHVRLGVEPQKSDQMVRSSVVLPHGTPKQKRIAVLTTDAAQQKAAQEAGAAIVGGDELLAEIKETEKLDADIVIATPDMMPKVASVARILGPQGLMPNPKTGTVTPNPAQAVKELAAGKLSFKMDQLGNLHEAVAKVSWEADRIIENTEAFLESVRAARPAAMKGELIKTVTVATTMSPGVRITAS